MLNNEIFLEEPLTLETLRNWADYYGATVSDFIEDGDLEGYRCVFFPRKPVLGVEKLLPSNHHVVFPPGTSLFSIFRYLKLHIS